MKRVLLTTFPTAFLHQGGGEREILLLNEALNGSGVISDIYSAQSLALSAYDCVIHFSMMAGSEFILDAVSEAGCRLILWPNLWLVTEPSENQLSQLRRFLERFDAVVFKSRSEEDHFSRFFDLSDLDVIRVYPLISSKFIRRDVSEVFRESYGLGEYVIWPGIIEPQKNQLAAVEAFADLNVELVLSGAVRDQDYLARCRRAAGDNIRFIPNMPFGSELHLSAIRHSRIFLELPLDFPGASALEAASIGANLLLSKCPWVEEMLSGACLQVQPDDIDGIRTAASSIIERHNHTREPRNYRSMPEAIVSLLDYLN
jgi:glycosyltransferase involved in cell wall biosynthesis